MISNMYSLSSPLIVPPALSSFSTSNISPYSSNILCYPIHNLPSLSFCPSIFLFSHSPSPYRPLLTPHLSLVECLCSSLAPRPLFSLSSPFLWIGFWEAPGGSAQAPCQYQWAKEELHGGRPRVQTQRVGQAPVHTLSIPHSGHQWSTSAQCRRGKSPKPATLR